MMLNLDPGAVAKEMVDLNRKLFTGLNNLRALGKVEVGETPREQISGQDKVRLFYYPPQGKAKQRPLLICYALVNRPYILDLQPDRSLIKGLTAQGIPVYLIDWGYPDATDRFLSLEDYITGYLDFCVDQVCDHAKMETLDLMGVCQGGTFSLCYSALVPQKIHSLICLVTPVDFATPENRLGQLTRQLDLELAIETYGNVPGFLLSQLYNSLMPARLGLGKQLDLPDQLATPEQASNYLRMETWLNDSPDLAGEACREFVEGFYRGNLLVEGGLKIGDREVDPKCYQGPVLNLFAARDHLVPPSASRALKGLTGSSDYSEHELPGGHIGVFAGRQAQHKLPDLIQKWLSARR